MKRTFNILIFFLVSNLILFGQEIPIPANYSIIKYVKGDLDNDNIEELVVAYNTKPIDDIESVPRELIIYKLEKENWTEWKKSNQALYGSRDGGMMGDPFGDIEINNGILLISQDGGSSWKWGFIDKYRYQNGEFYLIGYTSLNGKLCEYWENVDFNLSTGKIIVTKEFEKCEDGEQPIYKKENETFYKKGITIKIQDRNEKDIIIESPKYDHKIYIANKIK